MPLVAMQPDGPSMAHRTAARGGRHSYPTHALPRAAAAGSWRRERARVRVRRLFLSADDGAWDAATEGWAGRPRQRSEPRRGGGMRRLLDAHQPAPGWPPVSAPPSPPLPCINRWHGAGRGRGNMSRAPRFFKLPPNRPAQPLSLILRDLIRNPRISVAA